MAYEVSPSSAHVKIVSSNNETLQAAFQFDDPDVTLWNFTAKTFKMDIKANREALTPLLSLTSGGGQIVVDDAVNRVLHLLVAPAVIQAAMPPGCYVYDFLMIDGASVVTQLMHGEFTLTDGITED